MSEPEPYQPTRKELQGESWEACYGVQESMPLRPLESDDEHHQ